MRSALTLAALFFCSIADAGVSHWVPFDNENGHITIPVTINGIETTAILDSGANANGISEYFLEEHELDYRKGKRIVLQGAYGRREANEIGEIDVGMFGTSFEVNGLMPIRTNSFGFLIGLGFFNNFILQIDYPNSQLRIITRDAFDLKEFANVPMRKDGDSGHPIVRVGINNDRDLWLMLDTGSTGGLTIERRVAEGAGWLEEFNVSSGLSQGVNSIASMERFRIPEVELGPFVLENVLVSVPAEGQDTNLNQGARQRTATRIKRATSEGILGYDLLKHFIVTIDFRGSYLHIEPPPE